MQRDGLSREEANDLIKETTDLILSSDPFDADEIMADMLGLEPDYIVDLLGYWLWKWYSQTIAVCARRNGDTQSVQITSSPMLMQCLDSWKSILAHLTQSQSDFSRLVLICSCALIRAHDIESVQPSSPTTDSRDTNLSEVASLSATLMASTTTTSLRCLTD